MQNKKKLLSKIMLVFVIIVIIINIFLVKIPQY